MKSPGLLQPLAVPTQAWQIVCMDFIDGLPKSHRFDSIMVVVDKFTKYANFVPLSHPYTTLQVAQALLTMFISCMGCRVGLCLIGTRSL